MADEQKKAALDEMNRLWENDMKPLVDQLHAKVDGVVTSIEEKVDALVREKTDRLNQRFDELEAQTKAPSPVTPPEKKADPVTGITPEELRLWEGAYRKAIRGTRSRYRLTEQEEKLLENGPSAFKGLATDTGSSGGYLLPVTMATVIKELLREGDPIRQYAEVVTLSVGDTWEQPVEGSTEFDAAWVAERGSRSETTSGDFDLEQIPAHEMYAAPRATRKMLDDAAFDMDAWINRKVADKFSRLEGVAFVNGSGSGQPKGILQDGRITTVNSGHATLVTGDGIWDLVYALPEYYTRNARFFMRRATVGAVRKLQDSNGQYLWAPGFDETPATIAGFPYSEAPTVPAVAASAVAIIFGDLRQGYLIADRVGIRFILDELTAKPHVEFYFTRRVGGQVVLPEAIRTQTISA